MDAGKTCKVREFGFRAGSDGRFVQERMTPSLNVVCLRRITPVLAPEEWLGLWELDIRGRSWGCG
jgi:hypothetical protein